MNTKHPHSDEPLRKIRPWSFWALIAFVIVNLPVYYDLYLNHWHEPLTGHVLLGDSTATWYELSPVNTPIYAERIGVSLYIDLTNTGHEPIYIEGYSASVRMGSTWVELPKLDGPVLLPSSVAYIDWQNKYMARSDLAENGLDYLTKNKPIEPGGVLRAWMFFRSIPASSAQGQVEKFRFAFLDSLQKNHVVTCAPLNKGSPVDIGAEIRLMPREPIPPSLQHVVGEPGLKN